MCINTLTTFIYLALNSQVFDSTANQLCFITHRIYESLQNGKEVRAVFIDLSRAFDKVSHPHLLYKLKTFGIGGSLLKWLSSLFM